MSAWFIQYALRTILPSGAGIKGVEETNLAAFLRQYRREAPPLMRLGLWLTTWIYLWSPILTIYVPLPLFFLPRSLREKHAFRAATHRWYLMRQSMLMLKMVAGLCWGQDQEVRSGLGVPLLEGDPGTFQGDS
ncbi:MAG: hypothetical protein CMH54_14920 [Myxococcales bacterium]|nr:hypothetical protein [Myxococcales bacterium]|tara:strand:- start:35 stop:433 length:399 start_codon:yes stop_codon:yes gene_type:complete